MTAQQSTTKVDINYPKLPEPKYSRIVDGLPCITIYEHQHLMRAYIDADRAARAPADSVLADAERLEFAMQHGIPMEREHPEALRLAEWIESDMSCDGDAEIAAELRRLHAENTTLQQGYDAARLEIESLQARVQELEAQLEAIGAGGVEPLRRRECLHKISEPGVAPEHALKDVRCGRCGYMTYHREHIGCIRAAAPATQAQAGAVPLTDEQIQEAILPINPHGMGYFLRIARAIERAHGIGIKDGDSHE